MAAAEAADVAAAEAASVSTPEAATVSTPEAPTVSTSTPAARKRVSGQSAGERGSPPEPIKDWSLTTLKDKLIKIGAKVRPLDRAFALLDL